MVAKGQDYGGESKSPDIGMLATKSSLPETKLIFQFVTFKGLGEGVGTVEI